ncbi:hypothetical protein P3S68_009755 [Capsicum galapagoense]
MSLLFRSLPTVALRSKPCPLTCLPFYFFNFHINSRPTSLIINPPRRPLSSSSSSTSVVVTDNRIPLSPPPNTTDSLQWVSRNQYCGELTENDVGKRVRLCGWVALHRIHGGLTFVNLRDQTGIVQITTLPDDFPDAHSTMNGLRLEYVVAIEGVVRPRPAESVNKKMKTGTIEMSSNIILLNRVVKLLRRYLEDVHDFVEIETPILSRSSPEGARDYLVP